MFDHFKSGWDVVKSGLVGWIIFGIVLMVLMSFGIGIFLMPNAYRAIRNATQARAAPRPRSGGCSTSTTSWMTR